MNHVAVEVNGNVNSFLQVLYYINLTVSQLQHCTLMDKMRCKQSLLNAQALHINHASKPNIRMSVMITFLPVS